MLLCNQKRFGKTNYVTLIMAQDAPKRRFLSLIFLVSYYVTTNEIQRKQQADCVHILRKSARPS